MARHPYIFVSPQRVGVTFNDQAGNVYLYSSPIANLAFGSPTMIGTEITTTFRDFPKGFFLPDNSIAVAWHGFAASGPLIYVAKEANGFASDPASSGAPGKPCECCPLDAFVTTEDKVLVAFRNNDNDVRDMWAVTSPASNSTFTAKQVSTTEGALSICPMQGPRVADFGGGHLLAVWSARGMGNSNTGTVYSSETMDGGTSWSGGAPLAGFVADEPTIALGANGNVYVTGVTGTEKSSMIESADGGKTWSQPQSIQVPDGAIAVPQPDTHGGTVVFAGVSAAKTVWMTRLE